MPAHRLLAHSPDAETRSGVTLRSVQFEVACDARHASDIAVALPPELLTPVQLSPEGPAHSSRAFLHVTNEKEVPMVRAPPKE